MYDSAVSRIRAPAMIAFETGHRFRPLAPPSDAIKAFRALVRTRDDLVNHRIALTNQLQALLDSFWPGPLGCSIK
jgi:transposase